jgi:hypothetical protein
VYSRHDVYTTEMKGIVVMGIYLGQLPPAEIARLKAELAETLIAHFCYPRFFDNRTNELRMRPVDRAKRQEVWLFLSSVDFTSWGRVDLMSPDFQHQIERLFIQFVQRNRAFFGEQGRKRMSDVRMLINSSSSSVVQGLRGHLTGQRGAHPFGSPRANVSWSQSTGRQEPDWDQIATATMLLQQQLQELRGEARPGASNGAGVVANGTARRPQPQRPQSPTGTGSTGAEHDNITTLPTSASIPSANIPSPASTRPATISPNTPSTPARKLDSPTTSPLKPAASMASSPSSLAEQANGSASAVKSGPLTSSPTMKSGPLAQPAREVSGTLPPLGTRTSGPLPPADPVQASVASAMPTPSAPVQPRSVAQTAQPGTSTVAANPREANMLTVGEDDIAIFEQMRHQLIVWLRVEAIRAGLEVSSQTPAQLLDMLRQQARFDETRLQVVSTLINLSNQIIKTGVVSLLDYKQALMFHLMHTRH